VAQFTRDGAATLTLGIGAGDFGIVHTPATYPKPWFDNQGGVCAAFHVSKQLSALAHCHTIGLTSSMPREIQAISALLDEREGVWGANLTANPQQVELPTFSFQPVAMLDEPRFIGATPDVDFFATRERSLNSSVIGLPPYAVVHLRRPAVCKLLGSRRVDRMRLTGHELRVTEPDSLLNATVPHSIEPS
jgi:hypothetical protein